MYDTLHLPARLVPRLRVTSPQLPSFRQRIATVQERDECLSTLLLNNLSTFATTLGYWLTELATKKIGSTLS